MDVQTFWSPFALTLVNVTVRATVVLLIACGLPVLMRRSSAAERHAVWLATMLTLLGLPIAILSVPSIGVPVLPAERDRERNPVSGVSGESVAVIPTPVPPDRRIETPIVRPGSVTSNFGPKDRDVEVKMTSNFANAAERTAGSANGMHFEWTAWFLPGVCWVWFVGCALSLFVIVSGRRQTVRLVRESKPVDDETWLSLLTQSKQMLRLKGAVELRIHPTLPVPITLGLVRPVVLVPPTADDWSEVLKRTVLVHELVHVRRRDVASQTLARVACALYWFHPLSWFGLRRLRDERERSCDDAVVALGQRASDYAESLLQIAQCCRSSGIPSLAVAMAVGSSLERRVQALLDSRRSHAPLSRRFLTACTLVILCFLPLVSCLQPTARGQQPNSDSAERQPVPSPSESAGQSPTPQVKPDGVQAPGTIAGRVVTPDGTGIPGAEVALILDLNRDRSHDHAGDVLATATSNPLGEFVIQVPPEHRQSRAFAGIWARAAGHVVSRGNSSTTVGSLIDREAITIRLEETDGTKIRVLNAEGNAAEGADVILKRVRVPQGVAWQLPKPWEIQLTQTTSQAGTATIPHLSPGSLEELEILLPDGTGKFVYGINYFLNVRPAEGETQFEFRLPAFGSLEGKLELAAGAALAEDLQLTVFTVPGDPPERRHVVKVPVDEQGRFHIERLGVGLVSIPTFLPDDGVWRSSLDSLVEIRPGRQHDVTLQVAPGVIVRGRFVKSDTQAGVAEYQCKVIYGPAIRYRRDHDWQTIDIETDADGRFECRLPPGPINLRTSTYVEGYQVADSWLPREQRGIWGMKFIIPDEVSFDLGTIELVKTVPVKGRLIDSDGNPLDDWVVFGYPLVPGLTQFETMNCVPGDHTERDGAFESRYPQTYPPRYWKTRQRVWKTKYEFDDLTYAARVISRNPLVLQADTGKVLESDDQVPIEPEADGSLDDDEQSDDPEPPASAANPKEDTTGTAKTSPLLNSREIVWGKPINGLQPGLWLVSPSIDEPRVDVNTAITYRVVLMNVAARELTFAAHLPAENRSVVPYLIPSENYVEALDLPALPERFRSRPPAGNEDWPVPSYVVTLAPGEAMILPGGFGLDDAQLWVQSDSPRTAAKVESLRPGMNWLVQPIQVHFAPFRPELRRDGLMGIAYTYTHYDKDGTPRREPARRIVATDGGQRLLATIQLEVGTLNAAATRHAALATWGKPDKGLQCGIRLITPQPEFKTGDVLEAELLWRNVSDETIVTPIPRKLDLYPILENAEERNLTLDFGGRFDLIPLSAELLPGDVRSLGTFEIAFVEEGTPSPKSNMEPAHATLDPGTYFLSGSGGVSGQNTGAPKSGKIELKVR